jgi:hypothetical protein|nr:MAG TPA: hypothetical protein [Caudoviricetes sp.]
MEGMTLFVSIVIIVFGILQIILFFKLWGMTNNIKELKKNYKENSNSLLLSIERLTSTVKNEIPKQEQAIVKKEIIKDKKENTVCVPPKKELPIIDITSDEYKKKIHKLKILKDRGFIEQAIKEYMEYTQLEYNSALEFINSL